MADDERCYWMEQSRRNWWSTPGALSDEQVAIGALMRIAAATEKMAAPYASMAMELEQRRKWHSEALARLRERDRQISNLRGQVTKLRNRLKTAQPAREPEPATSRDLT